MRGDENPLAPFSRGNFLRLLLTKSRLPCASRFGDPLGEGGVLAGLVDEIPLNRFFPRPSRARFAHPQERGKPTFLGGVSELKEGGREQRKLVRKIKGDSRYTGKL